VRGGVGAETAVDPLTEREGNPRDSYDAREQIEERDQPRKLEQEKS